jgi:hypothetical protein
MKLFAYWSAALNPSAERALLISYGVGNTAKALTEMPSLESIDIVDISRDLFELNQIVSPFPQDHPLHDPRVRVHIEDGRFFLQTTDSKFDLITGEPPPPKNAGVVNLYSQEYFQLIYDRLAPGGVANYWLPVYQMTLQETRAIVKAFCLAFSDCSLWTGAGTEWILAGTRDLTGPVEEEDFRRPWEDSNMGPHLRSIGVETPEQLGALFLGDAKLLTEWIENVEPLEDNYPHRISPRMLYGPEEMARRMEEYHKLMDVQATQSRFRESDFIRQLWPPEIRESTLNYFAHQDVVNRYFLQRTGIRDLYNVLAASSLRSLPLLLMGGDPAYRPILEKAIESGTNDAGLYFMLAGVAMSDRDYLRAVEYFEQALSIDPGSAELARYQILALLLAGDRAAAKTAAQALRSNDLPEHDPWFWSWLQNALGELD